jgi:ubiquinone/menaquinone biosynthesis C-methylase UbiE
MPIDFHAATNRDTYTTRQAEPGWHRTITAIVNPLGKRVVDIGCGGGIYTQAWAQLGAATVCGIDFSEQMLQAATARLSAMAKVSLQRGDAVTTGLPSGCADIVFARALLHHISDLSACLREAYRLLAPAGVYIIQDRTVDDVQIAGSRQHIRGYFFARFPHLLDVEVARRPRHNVLVDALQQVGFTTTQTLTLWETRQTYPHFAALAADLRQRTGRSILHELSDADLVALIAFIAEQLPPAEPVCEQDRWTLWYATRA